MKISKFILAFVLLIILIPFFNFLEYGFEFETREKIIYPILLSVITYLCFFIKPVKKYLLFLSLILIFLMVVFFLFNDLTVANKLGGFGFSIIIILTASLFPQLFKKGQIDKLT